MKEFVLKSSTNEKKNYILFSNIYAFLQFIWFYSEKEIFLLLFDPLASEFWDAVPCCVQMS